MDVRVVGRRVLARGADVVTHANVRGREDRARRRAERPGFGLLDVGDSLIRYRTSGAGPTLVLATDPPVVLEHYDELVAELAGDFRVVVFEPAGCGFSVTRPGFRFDFHGQNDSAARFLAGLGWGPATLVFSCVAAYGALDIAHRYPDLVDKLVLVQAPSWSEQLAWKARRDPRGVLSTPLLGQIAIQALKRRRAPAWFDLAVGDTTRSAALKEASDVAFREGATWGVASSFQRYLVPGLEPPAAVQPTLIVWGEADASHAATDRRSSASLARDPVLVSAPTLGHFPELEGPRWFSRELRSFLTRSAP